MAERSVVRLMTDLELAALRDLNAELGAWQVALQQGDDARTARARMALLDSLELYLKAHTALLLARREEQEEEDERG